MTLRAENRASGEIRELKLTRNYLPFPEGSCFVELGGTKVITTASFEDNVPQWLKGKGTGWVTAEYGMLPRSTNTRNKRIQSGQSPNGRTIEIQRLVGRSLRAVTDLEKLGERSIYIDCDVIIADGGTRVASIIGSAVSLFDAGTWLIKKGVIENHIMRELVAGISVGIIDSSINIDLCYEEDSRADVDMNVIMTESGKFIEIQGTAERKTFDRTMLDMMLDSAGAAIKKIISVQKEALGLL